MRALKDLPEFRDTASKASMVDGGEEYLRSLAQLPLDVIEHLLCYLAAREVVTLASTCKALRHVASTPKVWADLIMRSFLLEELPQDLGFLQCRSSCHLRSQFRQLSLQRPAFLSDAPRTSEILEHPGSHFRKVLHVDGRRDLNFTTVLRAVPPGHYTVVWRLLLQPGYVRGYCNFRAVFSRPAPDSRAHAKAKPRARALTTAAGAASQQRNWAKVLIPGRCGTNSSQRGLEGFPEDEISGGHGLVGTREQGPGRTAGAKATQVQLRRRLRWLTGCGGAPGGVMPNDLEEDEATAAAEVDSRGVVVAPQTATMDEALGMAAEADGLQRVGSGQQRRGSDPAPTPRIQSSLRGAGLMRPGPPEPPPQQQRTLAGNPRPQHPEIEPAPLQHPQPQADPQGPAAALAAERTQPRHQQPPAARQQHLQRAMGQLASVSVKRDAVLGNGCRYVPRWLLPLWGSHTSCWRQLDPSAPGGGPMGHDMWRTVQMGSLTVRRRADVHLRGVMVQLPPANVQQQAAAMPPGETRWRGALVDFVELVPTRRGGLIEGLLPGFLQSSSPVAPDAADVVALPRV